MYYFILKGGCTCTPLPTGLLMLCLACKGIDLHRNSGQTVVKLEAFHLLECLLLVHPKCLYELESVWFSLNGHGLKMFTRIAIATPPF